MAGLFAFQLIQNAMTVGVRSVTKGGRLILNSAFPRALLPLSAVITAFMRFLPTMVIYIPIHFASGLPVNAEHAVGDPDPVLLILFAAGLAMLVAAAQVYFRDLSNFLPYMLRIWLYISPVLYFADEVPHALQVAARRQPARRAADRVERRAVRGHRARRRARWRSGLAWGLGHLRRRRPVLPLPGA